MTQKPLTISDFERFDVIEAAHYNMGGAGFAYGFRAVKHLRLSFIDRYLTGLPRESESFGRRAWVKQVKREWYVDGVLVADLEAAVAALNVPPVFTDVERAALAQIPKRKVPLRIIRNIISGEIHQGVVIEWDSPTSRAMLLIDALRNKGAVTIGRRDGIKEKDLAPPVDDDGLPELKPMDDLARWATEPMIWRLIDVV